MSKAIKKSNAPLFVAYGADPNHHEVQSTAMTKEQALNYAAYDNKWSANKFEDGEIMCELVPIGFFYKNDDGEVVCGDVKQEDLINMLCLQADIEEGIAEHVPTDKYNAQVAKNKKERKKFEIQMEGARHFACDDGTLDKYGVEDALVTCKGYSFCDLRWDGDYCIIDVGYDAFEVAPCGTYHGRAVYDPYDVDRIPYAEGY